MRSARWCGTSVQRALSSVMCPPSGASPVGTGKNLESPAQTVSIVPLLPHLAQSQTPPIGPSPFPQSVVVAGTVLETLCHARERLSQAETVLGSLLH